MLFRSTKQRNNTSAVGLVNGSMAVARSSAKVKDSVRTRHLMTSVSVLESSQQVLSQSQSPYPVGSTFADATLLFSASQLSQNAQDWIQKFDKYRIKQVEVFVTAVAKTRGTNVTGNAPIEVYFYEDTDADPATLTSWIRTSDRDNLGRVVLNSFTPSMRLITFKPTLTFAAGTGAQDPSNVIMPKDSWLDALALPQLYSGLRVFACCARTDTSGQTYEWQLTFNSRFTIEAKQPL